MLRLFNDNIGVMKKRKSSDIRSECKNGISCPCKEQEMQGQKDTQGDQEAAPVFYIEISNTSMSSIVLSIIAMNVDSLTKQALLFFVFNGAYVGLNFEPTF